MWLSYSSFLSAGFYVHFAAVESAVRLFAEIFKRHGDNQTLTACFVVKNFFNPHVKNSSHAFYTAHLCAGYGELELETQTPHAGKTMQRVGGLILSKRWEEIQITMEDKQPVPFLKAVFLISCLQSASNRRETTFCYFTEWIQLLISLLHCKLHVMPWTDIGEGSRR